jgi:hypothetical protein
MNDRPSKSPLPNQDSVTLVAHIVVAALAVYAFDKVTSSEVSLSGRIALAVLVVLLILLQAWQYRISKAEREKREQTSEEFNRQIAELKQKLKEKSVLLKSLASQVSDVLADEITDLGAVFSTDPPARITYRHRKEIVPRALKRCCQIFELRALCDNTYLVDGSFFKATLFEIGIEEERGEVLRRAYWHYPPNKSPLTNEIVVKDHSNSAAVRCYRERKIVIVEDVPTEYKKEGARNWEDFRDGQHSEYKSMICVPLMWRIRGKDTVKTGVVTKEGTEEELRFVGVVTIDTNLERYFKEIEGEFISQMLAPLLACIRLAYILYDA